MKVLFAHDHYFFEDTNKTVFSEISFDYAMFQRYRDIFDHVVVAGRRDKRNRETWPQNLSESSGPSMSFVLLDSISGLKNRFKNRDLVYRELSQAISDVDRVIARLPSELGLAAIELAKKLRKPYLIEMVGCPWDALANYGNWQATLYAPILKRRTQNAVKRAELVLYVTGHYLQSKYPTNGLSVSASNVSLPPLADDVLNKRLQRIQNQGDRRIEIGFIGSLKSKYKGLDTLIAALSDASLKKANINVNILGFGDSAGWKDMAQQMGVAELLTFHPSLPGGQAVLEWLDQIDLFAQPSKQEGLPRTLLEAMSRGCPAIASTTGGIPELLEPQYLHKPGSVSQLRDLLHSSIAASSDKLCRRAKENFARADQYTIDKLMPKRKFILENLRDAADVKQS